MGGEVRRGMGDRRGLRGETREVRGEERVEEGWERGLGREAGPKAGVGCEVGEG